MYLFTCLFIFDCRALFVYIKDRNRIQIPAYCFRKSTFGVLLCLFIRKLILGSKTTWQSMRNFQYAVWSVVTFCHMEKEETSFLLKKNSLVWSESFLGNYFFMRPENLKISLEIWPQIFLRVKISNFAVFKGYTH